VAVRRTHKHARTHVTHVHTHSRTHTHTVAERFKGIGDSHLSKGVEATVYDRHTLGEIPNCNAVHQPAHAQDKLQSQHAVCWLHDPTPYLLTVSVLRERDQESQEGMEGHGRAGRYLGPISQVIAGGSGRVQVMVAGSATTCAVQVANSLSTSTP
jgi:hypothetical protein